MAVRLFLPKLLTIAHGRIMMFVACFSDEASTEAYWPAAFYLENTIRAILIEDGCELRGLSSEALQVELLAIGHGMGFPKSCPEPKPPESWFESYLARECPNLLVFLNNACQSGASEISPTDPGLLPKMTTIQQCRKNSEGFRTFLDISAEFWRK